MWKQDGWLRDGSAGKPCWYIFGEDEVTHAREAGWQLELVAAGMSHVTGALLQYDNNYYVGCKVTVHYIKVVVKPSTREGQPVVRTHQRYGDQRYARAHVAGVHPWGSAFDRLNAAPGVNVHAAGRSFITRDTVYLVTKKSVHSARAATARGFP